MESRVFAYQASFRNRRPFDSASPRPAGVVQWQNTSLPSWPRGFDSPHPLQPRPQRRQLVVTRTGHHPQERECRFFFSCRCRKRGPGGAWGNLCPQKAGSTRPPQSTAGGPERREVLPGGLPLRGGRRQASVAQQVERAGAEQDCWPPVRVRPLAPISQGRKDAITRRWRTGRNPCEMPERELNLFLSISFLLAG